MFKKKILPVFISTILLLSGCDKSAMNEDMPSGKLVSWKTPANYYSSYKKLYLFANSMNGELLECMDLNITQENTFAVDRIKNGLSERFILSRLSVRELTSYKEISIYTYYGILPFSKEQAASTSTYIGNAQVKLSDVPTYTSFILSSAGYSNTYSPLNTTTFNISIYSDRLNSLYIRLNRATGTYYKTFTNLIPNQLNTLSLSDLKSDFTQGQISFNKGTYSSFSLEVSKYGNTGFTGGSYFVGNGNGTNSPVSYTLPASFLPSASCITELYGSDTYHNTSTYLYSKSVPATLALMDGTFSLSGSLPDISYNLNLNEKADVVYLYFIHSSDFTNTNKYKVIWRIYLSPSVRTIKLPDIPQIILTNLRDSYGISDLKLSQVKYYSASCYQYFESNNFDEFMANYFFGWKNPSDGMTDKLIYFYPSTTKGGTEGAKTDTEPYRLTEDTDF